MQPEQDETAFEWIRRGRDERRMPESRNALSAERRGVFVSHLMPPVFEAYAKILHRIDAYYENIDNPLSGAEIAILKIPPCEPLKTFVEQRRAYGQGTRIRWRELAELLNVPFVAELDWTWYRKKLEEGCSSRFLRSGGAWPVGGECTELASTLLPFAQTESCFSQFSEIPFIGEKRPPLFKGSVDEVSSFLKAGGYRCGFEYWWPVDHTWCVCSDFDLSVTVVAGSSKLISALLSSSILESIEVKSQTRIDPFVPMPS
jgi:hypothetical protein